MPSLYTHTTIQVNVLLEYHIKVCSIRVIRFQLDFSSV